VLYRRQLYWHVYFRNSEHGRTAGVPAQSLPNIELTKYHDFVGLSEVSGKVVDNNNSGKEIPGVEVTFRLLNEVAIASICIDTGDDDNVVSPGYILRAGSI
jgi:hypothetical protein